MHGLANNNMPTHKELTKNQSLVMGVLSQANNPLSAYSILDELRDAGFRAPLQVYRALDKLIAIGLVHRLESLNAFVACQHKHCDSADNRTLMFTICEMCSDVQEIASSNLTTPVNKLAKSIDFSLEKSTIELRGICTKCKTD